MRISDWSSDVCSSDLDDVAKAHRFAHPFEGAALERKPFAIAVVIIARRAPESEHRILFLRFEDVAAYEVGVFVGLEVAERSEEHTSELQSLMRISYAVFCLKKKKLIQQEYKLHSTSSTNI